MTSHTVTRTIPIDDWTSDPSTHVNAFIIAGAQEAADHGCTIPPVEYTASIHALAEVRLTATWGRESDRTS
jgi:hypothetical protein